MGTLQIKLFGQVEIGYANAPAPLKLTRATQEIFAFLLVNVGKMYRRETVMDVFWPDQGAERARSCLNSAVWRLRRELQRQNIGQTNYIIATDSGEIGFNWACDYQLDVQHFEHTLLPMLRKPLTEIQEAEAEGVAHALRNYRGDLVEGIYDDWTLIERERLREMYINGLVQLMNYYSYSSAFTKSLEFGKAILEKDPIREDVHRKVMRLYVLAGQRTLAIKQYQTCCTILRDELGIAPMEETVQLHRKILDDDVARPSADADVTPVRDNLREQIHFVMQNLEIAQTHLMKAAQLIAHLVPLNAETREMEDSANFLKNE